MSDAHLHVAVEGWFLDTCRVDPVTADLVAEAIDLVAEHGALVGQPLVKRLFIGRFYAMCELRPGRLLFTFSPPGEALFLVAGAGSQQWYHDARPLADDRFERFLSGPGDMVSWRSVKGEIQTADPAWDAPERQARRAHIRQEMLAAVTATRLEFASIVQRLMDSRQLSLQVVSLASGLDASTINRLLTGTPPTAEVLRGLAPILRIPLADLLLIAGLPPTEPQSDRRQPPLNIGLLVAIANSLTAEQVGQLIESAKNLRAS